MNRTRPPRWGVVATVWESPEVCAAFAAHHLAIGAEKVYLFLDQPDSAAEALLARLPGCHVTVCDDRYWQSRPSGRRSKAQEVRQRKNAYSAYTATDLDWLAHLDADEFLNPGPDFPAELAAVPEEIAFVKFNMRERVFCSDDMQSSLYDGVFRVPVSLARDLHTTLIGPIEEFTQGGFSGHLVGKSIVRCGLDSIVMGIHGPRATGGAGTQLKSLESRQTTVLHFDGLTPQQWCEKLAIYGERHGLENPAFPAGRMNQIRFILENRGQPGAVRQLHDRLKTVTGQQMDHLLALGYLERADVDPAKSLARFGLGDVDLTPERLNAWLVAAGLMRVPERA